MEDSLEMTFISLLYSILEQCSMFWLLPHVFRVADKIYGERGGVKNKMAVKQFILVFGSDV